MEIETDDYIVSYDDSEDIKTLVFNRVMQFFLKSIMLLMEKALCNVMIL